MSKTPTPTELRGVALWLFSQTDASSVATRRVATWLNAQADAAEQREIARKNGLTVGKVREHLVIAKKLQG